jgi:hypothetical protein
MRSSTGISKSPCGERDRAVLSSANLGMRLRDKHYVAGLTTIPPPLTALPTGRPLAAGDLFCVSIEWGPEIQLALVTSAFLCLRARLIGRIHIDRDGQMAEMFLKQRFDVFPIKPAHSCRKTR